jgi:hypothetical protein
MAISDQLSDEEQAIMVFLKQYFESAGSPVFLLSFFSGSPTPPADQSGCTGRAGALEFSFAGSACKPTKWGF